MAGSGRKVFAAGDVLTATDVQNYLKDQAVMVFASSAARGSAIASPTEGMVSYLSDTNNVEAYTGSAWTTVGLSGLVPVAPTSIANSGGSASTSGYTTTFTGVSSISLNGVFSADYDNYRIMVRHTGSTSYGFRIRLRASGTDASGNDYRNQQIYTSGSATVLGAYNASTQGEIGPGGTNAVLLGADIQDPNRSAQTGVVGQSARDGDFSNFGIVHTLSSAYDGFTLFPSTGTLTGVVSVYGYRK